VVAPVSAGAVESAPAVVGVVVGVVVAAVLLGELSSSELLQAASANARAPASPRPLTQRRIDILLRRRATYRLSPTVGLAPHTHRCPASWRSHGQPAVLASLPRQ
jgi:hypothetical protein